MPGRRFGRRPGSLLKWVSGSCLGVGIIGVGAVLLSDPLPSEDLKQARAAIAEAEAAGAVELAPEALTEARAHWDRAVLFLDSTSSRLWPYRSYDSVSVLSVRARGQAEWARRASERAVDSLTTAVVERGEYIAEAMADAKRIARHYPPSQKLMNHLVEAERLVAQAQGAALKGNPLRAAQLADEAQAAVAEALQRHRVLQDSLASEAESWGARYRAMTPAGSFPFIAVDKRARLLMVHYAPGRVDTLAVELGPEWLGDKAREGDKRTPEGLYRVSRRLGAGQTKYHRALVLNYPNDRDRMRFAAAKREGRLATTDRIGGLIEIHGGGGKSGDWTDGCVALPDAQMERLFDRIPLNTPVLIAPALLEPAGR